MSTNNEKSVVTKLANLAAYTAAGYLAYSAVKRIWGLGRWGHWIIVSAVSSVAALFSLVVIVAPVLDVFLGVRLDPESFVRTSFYISPVIGMIVGGCFIGIIGNKSMRLAYRSSDLSEKIMRKYSAEQEVKAAAERHSAMIKAQQEIMQIRAEYPASLGDQWDAVQFEIGVLESLLPPGVQRITVPGDPAVVRALKHAEIREQELTILMQEQELNGIEDTYEVPPVDLPPLELLRVDPPTEPKPEPVKVRSNEQMLLLVCLSLTFGLGFLSWTLLHLKPATDASEIYALFGGTISLVVACCTAGLTAYQTLRCCSK